MVAEAPEGMTTNAICRKLGVTPQQIGDDIQVLIENDNLIGFAGLWLAPPVYREHAEKFLAALQEEHTKTPSVPGIDPELAAKRAQLNWRAKVLDRIVSDLVGRGKLTATDGLVRLPDFHPSLPPRQRELLDRVKHELELEPINVPSAHDVARILGVPHQAVTTILRVGIASGELIQLDESVTYTPHQLEAIWQQMLAITQDRARSTGEMREALGTTRKYVLPLLAHFERVGRLTRRGDGWMALR